MDGHHMHIGGERVSEAMQCSTRYHNRHTSGQVEYRRMEGRERSQQRGKCHSGDCTATTSLCRKKRFEATGELRQKKLSVATARDQVQAARLHALGAFDTRHPSCRSSDGRKVTLTMTESNLSISQPLNVWGRLHPKTNQFQHRINCLFHRVGFSHTFRTEFIEP